ncbi:MAG TPA: DUF4397 domain-containing protein [Streptosporangiaceae bacterium]|nr:DUF4397 domain-containing protein [Streptosporangiaceae bacterium]
MRLLRHCARLAGITALLMGAGALVAAISPAAYAASTTSAASAASLDGWVRIAHLSPQAPAMDMYMYPFGDPSQATILRDVAYGDVSAYMALSPGQYTVAMRGFGAPASSAPALTTSFMVGARTAYTLAALGPDPGLRVAVLQDQMSTPTGKALVRVFQASLKDPVVTVSYGPDVIARQLTFGSATSYTAVSPGAQTVRFTASGADAAMSVTLAADTVHTIVVLDGSSGLKVDNLTDAAGSQIMPAGGADTGFGGTAPRPPADPVPWLLVIAAGSLLTATGLVGLRRARHLAV